MLSISTVASGIFARIRRVASIPLTPGSAQSITTTFGFNSSASRTASSPSLASPTTEIAASSSNMRRNPLRTSARSFRRLRVSIPAKCLPQARHARAFQPARYLGARRPEKIPCRGLQLPGLWSRLEILAAPRPLVLPHGALHYSGPPATHDIPARQQYHPQGTQRPTFRNAASARFAARPWEYTNRACSPVPVRRAALGAALATSCEYCSAWIARFRELLGDPGAAARPAEPAFPPCSAASQSRSAPGRIRRAARVKCGGAWTPAWQSVSAPDRCAVRRALRAARKSAGSNESGTDW